MIFVLSGVHHLERQFTKQMCCYLSLLAPILLLLVVVKFVTYFCSTVVACLNVKQQRRFRAFFTNGVYNNESIDIAASRVGRQVYWISDLGDYEG